MKTRIKETNGRFYPQIKDWKTLFIWTTLHDSWNVPVFGNTMKEGEEILDGFKKDRIHTYHNL